MIPTALFPAEHSVLVWYHRPTPDETLEDVLKPEYWVHTAGQLRPGNRIEMLWADGSKWAMLLVRSSQRGGVLMHCLQEATLGRQSSPEVPGTYSVKWRGPKAKFGVVRVTDGEVLRDGFDLREQAEDFLTDHIKAMAA